jgi:hypothetical protein
MKTATAIKETRNTEAIVMSASCTPAANCWGRYKRVAVVIVDRDVLRELGREVPQMISKHAKGVVRIVKLWENQNVGTTVNCAYQRALIEASDLADKINEQIEKGEWS